MFFSLLHMPSFGQLRQKKMVLNKTSSTIAPAATNQSAVKTDAAVKAAPIAKPNVALKTTSQIVFLNTHNVLYKQKILNPVLAKIVASHAKPFFAYNKTINFPDKSSLHIGLIKSPSFALQPDKVSPVLKSSSSSSDNQWDCVTNVVNLSATSTNFLNNNYSAQTSHIYPGAIYTYDHLYDGSFKEETQNRNPIYIGSDNPNMTGSTYEEVPSPSMFTIDDAIAKLYRRFTGPAANESNTYQIFESDNSSDFALKVGAGASGYGFSISNQYSTASQQNHYYLTIDAKKTLFSISTSVPDSGYFKTHVDGSSPYVVLGNVSYGVRVLANLDFTFSSQEDEDKLKAAYSGYSVNANVDFDVLQKSISSTTKINAYIIGGPSSGTTIAFTSDQLKQQIDNILTNATYSNARPISYQLYDMDGNVIGAMSATDQFTDRTCTPSNLSKTLQTPITATIKTGGAPGDNKDGDTHFSFGFFDQSGRQLAVFHDDSNNDEYAEGTSRTVQMTSAIQSVYKPVPVTASLSDFAQKGGHVHLNVAPNGHDTWKISSFTLNLNFANDLKPHPVTWTNIVMSQNARDIDLYFDNGFNPEQ